MTVSVILEGTLKEGERDGFTAICTEAFKATRAFDGCQGIDLTYNTESPNNWIFTDFRFKQYIFRWPMRNFNTYYF